MDTPIVPFDWSRIWLGDVSPLFLLEIVFRTAVIFVWLVLLLRFIGRRSLGQFSTLELGIVIALGSAAGDPLLYPEVPLTHAMLVLALLVGFQRLLNLWMLRSEAVETFVDGVPVELVRGGVLREEQLRRASLSREELFEVLRLHGVRQLGQVQRAYYEQGGQVSVFRAPEPAPPGLPVVPPWDLEPPPELSGPDGDAPVACLECGTVSAGAAPVACPACGARRWTPARHDPLAPDSAAPLPTAKPR